MTDPYAPPKVEGNATQPSWSLSSQIIWQTLIGGIYAAVLVSAPDQLMDPHRPIQTRGAIAVVVATISCRAWFCGSSRQLFTSATALSWGFLSTYVLLISIQAARVSVTWTRFVPALLILPVILTLIGLPVMYISRRRRHKDRSSGDGR